MIERLSVIEVQSPLGVPRLVPRLEALGYHRFWTTEHYSATQSASPIVLAGIAASVTTRMRIGTAGVLMHYQTASRVAQHFHLLEALFPGRIDAGIIGSAPESTDTAQGEPDRAQDVKARVAHLAKLLRADEGVAPPNGISTIRAKTSPAFWICGLSERSACLAAELGAGFVFSPYLAQTPSEEAPLASVATYRDRFVSRDGISQPEVIITCYGVCAPSERFATACWGTRPWRPSFLGEPARCRDQLEGCAERYAVPEVVVQCFGDTDDRRIEAYELLADALHLDADASLPAALIGPAGF